MATENVPAVVNKEVTTKDGRVLKFSDLVGNMELAVKNDEFKTLLNQKPRKEWIKAHPIATKKIKNERGTIQEVPLEYLPIDKVEFLMDYIFQDWKTEIKSIMPLFNSIAVVVRLRFKNPMTGKWSYHDGAGAAPVQVDKGESAADLGKIKANAVQIGLPAAVSYAIKDAAEHLGDIFGRNMNRADAITFTGAYLNKPQHPVSADAENKRILELIKNAANIDALNKLSLHIKTNEQRITWDAKYKELNFKESKQ